jgi:hypothetical protein
MIIEKLDQFSLKKLVIAPRGTESFILRLQAASPEAENRKARFLEV